MSETNAPRILVVDDDDMLLEVLQAYLQTEGYEVILTASGEAALKQIEKQLPDLILLDARLGNMDGYEVCEKLKADAKTRSIPVLLISALSSDEDKKHAIAVGVDDFIGKPFDAVIMLHRIHTLLRYKKRWDTLLEILPQHVAPATAKAMLDQLEGA